MASNPKSRSKAKSAKPKSSALDQEQQQLLAEQRALQAQIEAIERDLKEAPKRAAEESRRTREAVQAATPRRGVYLHGANLLDTRHVEAAAASGRTRPSKGRKKPVVLRQERADGRRQTLVLLIALAAAIFWGITHYLL